MNSSSINDGAAALVLASGEAVSRMHLDTLARIVSFADAACDPSEFTTAPSLAIPLALKRACWKLSDVDYFEINEAFSVVAIVNMRLLGLDAKKVNLHGGAVSLGHPLGCSGARIIVTLINVLKANGGRRGVAAICNGGGGATAICIELTNKTASIAKL